MKVKVVLAGILVLMVAGSTVWAQTAPTAKQVATEKVATLDTNKDGKITYDEYSVNCERRHVSSAECDARFQKLDADGDGYLTKEEAKETEARVKENIRQRRMDRQSGTQQ